EGTLFSAETGLRSGRGPCGAGRGLGRGESAGVPQPLPPVGPVQAPVVGADDAPFPAARLQDQLVAADFAHEPELVDVVVVPVAARLGPDVTGASARVRA